MCGYHASNNIVAGKIKMILEDNSIFSQLAVCLFS